MGRLEKAAVGLGELLTFIVLEFMAIAAAIAAFLSFVLASEESLRD